MDHFELIQESYVKEIASTARLFRHIQTGARILSLENDDENKVFGISFRTPPSDSTGIAHILEHSVLCGSRKYPIKEPFAELLKGSLKTFLNAFTYSDKTCYPVASQNCKDFYNLIDVYLDAVFYPRLTPEIFQQEGWHYELEATDRPMVFKGVVYNEMKGAFSSAERLLAEYAERSLFPNTTYGYSSGGDPRNIPDLSYEQFKQFHTTCYHPSNAYIFFYGDDDPQQRLQIIHEYLKDFTQRETNTAIDLQPPFDAPRRATFSYAIDPRTPREKQAMMCVNWLLTETNDQHMNFMLNILGYILVGMLASPLRKALIESGLGEDLVGGGIHGGIRQSFFSVGLKGISADDVEKIEHLIFETLERLVQEGIDPQTIEAAVNTFEFYMRENNTGSAPRGLVVMIRALNSWLYDGDPLEPLAFEVPLTTLKARIESDKRVFESLIEQFLLKNRHRTTVTLLPDPEFLQRLATEERTRLDQARQAMSEQDVAATLMATKKLKEMQETPDSPEALATIPRLQLSDLDRVNKIIPLQVFDRHMGEQEPVFYRDGDSHDFSPNAAIWPFPTGTIYHNIHTNGIVYVDMGFNTHVLPQELLPYTVLFGRALREMGTQREDYAQLSQRIGCKTGGIRTQPINMSIRNRSTATSWLFLRAKATLSHSQDLLDILRDMLLTVRLDNQERFRQILLEARAREEASVVPSGNGYVNLRLRSLFGEADWVNEHMGGISYLFFLRELIDQVENHWPNVLAKLQTIQELLINQRTILCNVTLDGSGWHTFQPQLQTFLANLPDSPATLKVWTPTYGKGFEGLTAPSQVNFVGKATNLYRAGYERHGSIGVITNYLRTTWLWEQVRVKGGAYGCFCRFGRYSGVFIFVSYRDPNVLSTLDVYDRAGQFLREVALSHSEVTSSIIGAISNFDAYQLPDAKGFTSMLRYLTGHTDEIRQVKREEILSTTAADFRAFADMLDVVRDQGIVTVLGSPDSIDAVNAERPGFLTPVKVV